MQERFWRVSFNTWTRLVSAPSARSSMATHRTRLEAVSRKHGASQKCCGAGQRRPARASSGFVSLSFEARQNAPPHQSYRELIAPCRTLHCRVLCDKTEVIGVNSAPEMSLERLPRLSDEKDGDECIKRCGCGNARVDGLAGLRSLKTRLASARIAWKAQDLKRLSLGNRSFVASR